MPAFLAIAKRPRVVQLRRLTVAAIGLVAIGVAAVKYAPGWVAYPAGVILAALAGAISSELAPTVVRSFRTSDQPLHASVGADSNILSDGWSMLLPADLPTDGRPPSDSRPMDVRAWVASLGAADSGTTFLKLVLEGRAESTVLLRDVRAEVLMRGEPITETLVMWESAGAANAQVLGLDLDSDHPRALTVLTRHQGIDYFLWDAPFGPPVFGDYHSSLTRGEIQVFNIVARTTRDYCEWRLALDLTIQGEEQSLHLDASGEPFRTSPQAATPARTYSWSWWEPPQRFVERNPPP